MTLDNTARRNGAGEPGDDRPLDTSPGPAGSEIHHEIGDVRETETRAALGAAGDTQSSHAPTS